MVNNLTRISNGLKGRLIYQLLTLIGGSAFIYVFYIGYFRLPPHLNTILVFFVLLMGAAAIFNSTQLLSKTVALVFTIGLFFLPLSWVWRGLTFDHSIFLGLFPFNDAIIFLKDANRLLYGLSFSSFSTRRPMFTGLLAFFLAITGNNLQIALGIFCLITAVSAYMLAIEIRKHIGPIAAGMVLVITFYCYEGHGFVGRVLTENLGLPLGTLALAILLKGIRTRSFTSIVIGAFSLSAALNARAGAFFALPALVLWAAFFYARKPKNSWKIVVAIIGAITLAFLANYFLAKIIGSKDGQLFSNFGTTLYGLAAGYKGWWSAPSGADPYKIAFELIKNNPLNLIIGILRSFQDYLIPQTMFQYMYFGNDQKLISYILYALTIVGLYRLWMNRQTPFASFLLIIFTGCFLSVSFLPPIDEGIRAITATIPINALVIGYAFSLKLDNESEEPTGINWRIPEIFALVLIGAAFVGPITLKMTGRAPTTIPEIPCSAGYEPLTLQVSGGNYVNILENATKFGFIPNIRKKELVTIYKSFNTEGLPVLFDLNFGDDYFLGLYDAIRALYPGDSIIMGLRMQDFKTVNGPDKLVFLITKTNSIQNIGGVNKFCVKFADEERLKGNSFYYEISMESE